MKEKFVLVTRLRATFMREGTKTNTEVHAADLDKYRWTVLLGRMVTDWPSSHQHNFTTLKEWLSDHEIPFHVVPKKS